MGIEYIVGDTREATAGIASGSIALVATSPPFITLRAYLPADHPDKALEIGSEPDPATFIDVLLGLTAEWGRVLAPWGSIAIELGDTFSGSGGAGGDYNLGGLREGQEKFNGSAYQARQDTKTHKVIARDGGAPGGGIPNLHGRPQGSGAGWPLPKSLALIPQLYATSLAYGRNMLTGEPSPAGRWRVRNVVVWHRPNPSPGALADKFRPSTSYITVATRAKNRWYDLAAVRGTGSANTHARTAKGVESRPTTGKSADRDGNFDTLDTMHLTEGSPPLDTWFDEYDGDEHMVWTITGQPSKLAHYAMWPARLAERLILAMCPEHVCTVCGEPRRRIEAKTAEYAATRDANPDHWTDGDHGRHVVFPSGPSGYTAQRNTAGWSDCGHDAYVRGVVLDPFAGTGTTIAVADLRGRDGIGIDINVANASLYPARYDECKKALFGTPVPDPNQTALF